MNDPRHTFLSASEVMARYSWGKTKGYQNLKDRLLVPAPVMTHPDRWRLDQLLAWEERRMDLARRGGSAGRASPGTHLDHRPSPPAEAAVSVGLSWALLGSSSSGEPDRVSAQRQRSSLTLMTSAIINRSAVT